ncbi:Zinc finger protein 268, partial [Galemys pyrenaicus]
RTDTDCSQPSQSHGVANVSLLSSLQVPPVQEQHSYGDRIRNLPGQETPDQRPLPGGPRQRHKGRWTKQVLEWLLISQEQPRTTEPQVRYQHTKPNIIFKLEEEELWIMQTQIPSQGH